MQIFLLVSDPRLHLDLRQTPTMDCRTMVLVPCVVKRRRRLTTSWSLVCSVSEVWFKVLRCCRLQVLCPSATDSVVEWWLRAMNL
jgi:hypothetical protein